MKNKSTQNLFKIRDYNEEQVMISNFFYEILEGETVEGKDIPVNVAAYAAMYAVHKNLSKYPSWILIDKSDAAQLVRYVMELMRLYLHLEETKSDKPYSWYYFTRIIQKNLLSRLLKKKIAFHEDDLKHLIQLLQKNKVDGFPDGLFVRQLEKYLGKHTPGKPFKDLLDKYKDRLKPGEKTKLEAVMQKEHAGGEASPAAFNILQYKEGTPEENIPDPLAIDINEFLQSQKGARANAWQQLFYGADKWSNAAAGPKPAQMQSLIEGIGRVELEKKLQRWLTMAVNAKPMILESNEYYERIMYLHEYTVDILKGLIWLYVPLGDKKVAGQLAQLALNCHTSMSKAHAKIVQDIEDALPSYRVSHFRYLPDRLASTVFKVLGAMPGGVVELTALRNRISKPKVRTAIDKILEQSAKKQGVSKSELEDKAAPEL